jgi:uncharacterized protein (DUF2141 family)
MTIWWFFGSGARASRMRKGENIMWKSVGIGSLLLMLATSADAADLTVTVTGVRNSNGSVGVGIFNSEVNFPKPPPYGVFRIKASVAPVSFTVHNLPPGKYAVTSYHDENDNGKLDTDPTGLPTEGYGVSNDAREILSPPQFSKASFDLTEQGKAITITIKY